MPARRACWRKDLEITPLEVIHGSLPVIAYRFNDFAYVTDLKTIPDGWRVLKTIFREAANRGEQMIRGQAATRVRGLTNRLPNVGSEINSPSDAASD